MKNSITMKNPLKFYFCLFYIGLMAKLYILRGSVPDFLREFIISVASIIGILILPITTLICAVKNYNSPNVDWAGVEKRRSEWFKKDEEKG